MGSGLLAFYSLKYILNNYKIISIITYYSKKDPIQMKIIEISNKYNIPIIFIHDINNYDHLLSKLLILKPDLQIVASFKILPEKIIKIAKIGTFNLHPSLLPDYKGAAPVNWVLINGETYTGVSTFFISEKIDSGKIILQKKIYISRKDTFKYLFYKLSILGAKLVVHTINYLLNKYSIIQYQCLQNSKKLNKAPKIFQKDCEINWNYNIIKIYNKIRGLNDYPGAWTYINLSHTVYKLKIFDVDYLIMSHNYDIGCFIFKKHQLFISVLNGFIRVKTLQLENRKKMNIIDFYNGIINK
jgi:methionyl-tRNA formyltransferase